jgi:hypothetical protein
MRTELIHVGFGNFLAANKVVAIISPNSAPTKRVVQELKNKGMLIDMTNGRRTKAVVVTDSGHVALAAIAAETISSRLAATRAGGAHHLGQGEEEGE